MGTSRRRTTNADDPGINTADRRDDRVACRRTGDRRQTSCGWIDRSRGPVRPLIGCGSGRGNLGLRAGRQRQDGAGALVDWCGLQDRVAWVSVERGERDAQRFWLSLIDALGVAAEVVQRIDPAPGFRGDVAVDQLLSDLSFFDDSTVLVIDDLHELDSSDAPRWLKVFLLGPAFAAAGCVGDSGGSAAWPSSAASGGPADRGSGPGSAFLARGGEGVVSRGRDRALGWRRCAALGAHRGLGYGMYHMGGWPSTSGRERSIATKRRLPRQRRSSGTARWAGSSSLGSPPALARSRTPSRPRRRRRWPEAERSWRRCVASGWTTV